MTFTFRFYTIPGCRPCAEIKPAIESLITSNDGVAFEEVNLIDDQDFAQTLGIQATPTGVLYTGKNIRDAQEVVVIDALQQSNLSVVQAEIDRMKGTTTPSPSPSPLPVPSPQTEQSFLQKYGLPLGGLGLIFYAITR